MKTYIFITLGLIAILGKVNGEKELEKLVSGSFSKIFGSVKNKIQLEQIANNVTEESFLKYKQLFDKVYNRIEYKRRYETFKKKVKSVIKSKIDYLEGRSSYAKGINEFLDKLDELSEKLKPNSEVIDLESGDISEIAQYFNGSSEKVILPNNVDWRESGCVNIVVNQGPCRSCYAFAWTSVLQTMRCISSEGRDKDLVSAQMFIDCVPSLDPKGGGCNGNSLESIVKFLDQYDVIAFEKDYGYMLRKNVVCKMSYLDLRSKLVPARWDGSKIQFYRFRPDSPLKMAEYITTNGPIVVAIKVPKDFQYYKTGVFSKEDCEKQPDTAFWHAVVIIGFGTDSETGKDYWLVNNSWGEYWGQEGFGKIQRGNGACNIETHPFSIVS